MLVSFVIHLFVPAEDKKANSSVRFHSFSRKESIPEDELVLRERSFDYKHRYCGHCNTTTDIKEANFFGRWVTCLSWVVATLQLNLLSFNSFDKM